MSRGSGHDAVYTPHLRPSITESDNRVAGQHWLNVCDLASAAGVFQKRLQDLSVIEAVVVANHTGCERLDGLDG
ncbi:hypothetical protein NJB1507_33290 [Mycobacterium marinum]|nr:hypothetical protein NJB1507_33290 [Mycobacterium marinum]